MSMEKRRNRVEGRRSCSGRIRRWFAVVDQYVLLKYTSVARAQRRGTKEAVRFTITYRNPILAVMLSRADCRVMIHT